MNDNPESPTPQPGLPPGLDLAKICRHMSRKRGFANGFVRVAEGKVKQWEAVWYEYLFVDGRERRRQRTKIIGKKSDLTKREAEDQARELARGARPPEQHATFAELSDWYLCVKEGQVSKKWADTMRGLLQHHILPLLGQRPAAEIKLGEVQQGSTKLLGVSGLVHSSPRALLSSEQYLNWRSKKIESRKTQRTRPNYRVFAKPANVF